jgi:hypothetical protein
LIARLQSPQSYALRIHGRKRKIQTRKLVLSPPLFSIFADLAASPSIRFHLLHPTRTTTRLAYGDTYFAISLATETLFFHCSFPSWIFCYQINS